MSQEINVLYTNGIGDYGDVVCTNNIGDDPTKDIKEIKKSLQKLEESFKKTSLPLAPCYYSISRKKAFVYYDINIRRKQIAEKGWISNLSFQLFPPNKIQEEIRSRFGPGSYEVLTCDELGQVLLDREIIIPQKTKSTNKNVDILWNSSDYKSIDYSMLPIHHSKNGLNLLSFSKSRNEIVSFHGVFSEDVEGPFNISLLWGMEKWSEGTVEWVVSFRGVNSLGKTINYSDVTRDKELSKEQILDGDTFESDLQFDINHLFLKNSSFQIILSRCSESSQDTLTKEASLLSLSLSAKAKDKKADCFELEENQGDVFFSILSELNENDITFINSNPSILEGVVSYFEKSRQLKTKGGFIDLNILAQDLNIEQEFLVKIANLYVKYKKGYLRGKISVKQLSLKNLGIIPILKRKRWDWF